MKTVNFWILLFSSYFLFSFSYYNGGSNYWKILELAKVKAKFDPKTETFLHRTIYPPKVRQLKGKTIQLKGFIIPLDLKEGRIGLSRLEYGMYSCCSFDFSKFVEIKVTEAIQFKTNVPVVLEGRLRLNAEAASCSYTLEDTRCLNCEL